MSSAVSHEFIWSIHESLARHLCVQATFLFFAFLSLLLCGGECFVAGTYYRLYLQESAVRLPARRRVRVRHQQHAHRRQLVYELHYLFPHPTDFPRRSSGPVDVCRVTFRRRAVLPAPHYLARRNKPQHRPEHSVDVCS